MGKINFNFAPLPYINFGCGGFSKLSKLVSVYGKNLLLVTGASSLEKSRRLEDLTIRLKNESISCYHIRVTGEPSPETIDNAVKEFNSKKIDAVCAIGGGSVIDAGKAISAMLTVEDPVEIFLEGVGRSSHPGTKIPFIAVPTTAGTGSEMTKNAVISRVGRVGFKKSLRHDNFIPDSVLIDPELCMGLPLAVTVSTGLDAVSQLVESYISTKGNIMTDSLAIVALKTAAAALPLLAKGEEGSALREKMSYAAMISGITLANVGLGVVHGIAGALGGIVRVPHGAACGILLFKCMERTFESSIVAGDEIALNKFAALGRALAGNTSLNNIEAGRGFISMLSEWNENMKPGKLSSFGVKALDIENIASQSDNKNNPVQFGRREICEILEAVL